MWVESIVQVGEDSIGVCVQRLDAGARARAAISIAWITVQQQGIVAREPAAWSECVEDVLRQHVKLTIAEDRLSQLNAAWWSQVVSRALAQLVRENELLPDIQRQISRIERLALLPRSES